MKKRLLGITFGIVGVMLVACTSSEQSQNQVMEQSQDKEVVVIELDTSDDDVYEGMGMANPWVDSDKAGVLEATGFDLVAPEDAVNVAYSYMPSTGMAQLNYVWGNAMWVYRMQPSDELQDISGIYCEWNYTEETTVAGMDAVEYGYASGQDGDYIDSMEFTRVVNWYDAQNKVTYSLSVIGTDLDGLDTIVYAENLYNQQM